MKTKVIAVTSKLKPETKEARSRHIERSTHAHTVCVLLNVFAFLAFFFSGFNYDGVSPALPLACVLFGCSILYRPNVFKLK